MESLDYFVPLVGTFCLDEYGSIENVEVNRLLMDSRVPDKEFGNSLNRVM